MLLAVGFQDDKEVTSKFKAAFDSQLQQAPPTTVDCFWSDNGADWTRFGGQGSCSLARSVHTDKASCMCDSEYCNLVPPNK